MKYLIVLDHGAGEIHSFPFEGIQTDHLTLESIIKSKGLTVAHYMIANTDKVIRHDNISKKTKL